MNELRVWSITAALCGALVFAAIAWSQGQSPTSPRQRPGLPDVSEDGDTSRRDGDTSTRFGGGGGRFSGPAAVEQGEERGPEAPAREDTRRPRRQSATDGAPARPGGLTVVGGNGDRSGSPGLISGSGGGAGQFVHGERGLQGAQGGRGEQGGGRQQPAQGTAPGNFELILEREINYPPLPEGGDVLIDLIGPKSVSEFMDDIRIATLWNILVSESVRDRMLDFYITEASPQQAMEILKFHDLYYEFDEETGYLYVMSVEEYQRREFGKLDHRKFQLEHTGTAAVAPVAGSLLSSRGRMIADAATRQINVWDTVDNLDIIERTVTEMDAPLASREFHIEHAAFADVQAALAAMLSAAGSLWPDSRTSTLIAWDQPNILDRMEAALETLDIPVQSKTFYLDHVLAIDTLEYLEVLVSDRGVIQVDPRKNSIIVTDLPGRVDRIEETLAVIDQELATRTWVVDYADLDFLAENIEARIPPEMGEIVVNEEVHQITVTGIPSKLDEIDTFIKTADVQRKQVYIEAFIVEVGTDVEREFNINWSYFGSRGESPIFFDAGTGFNPEGGRLNVGQLPYSVPLHGALELNDSGQIVRPIVTNIEGNNVIDRIEGANLAVTLDYLDERNKATVLSSPRVAVQDGEEATFENATQVPFVSSTTFFNNAINNLGTTNNTNRVEFIDVGTILKVLPRITTKENILLDISAEDSTFVEVRVLASDQESTVPQKTVRRAETQLRIQSGDTVVLGGLRRDRAAKAETRTPFLGDLPGIGRLFRYPNKSSEKNTLLIFITPTIVDEFTDPQATLLAQAEESIAEEHRHNQKKFWGRLADTVSERDNELMVSVGQSGQLRAEGERATMADLRTLLEEAPAQVRVVLRRHPRAPGESVTAVMDLAMDLDRDLEIDDEFVPLVPRFREEEPAGSGAPMEAATAGVPLKPSAPAEP